jgi:hypothetical protein
VRHRSYIRQTLVDYGAVECLRFEYSHYGEASTAFTPAAGMHESAALYLMNKWNGASTNYSPNYKYWLEDGE